ncbi:MAG: putative hydroxymethylpyrimidine transporter CytX, partial [Candidatus Atribacteria bacterium]|nr:putative hydroxymethylpyrimidine transporter CytX [Candidatus Atribacteria bacterium]
SGAAISIAEIWAGGMLAPLGFWAGLLVILIGHVVGNTPLALGGIIGSEWGIPSMFSLRAAFGRSGSFLASIFNIIQLLGWTAIMVIICSRSINIISAHLFDYSNIRFWILVTGIGSTLWAMVGSKVWIWVQRVAVVALAGLCIFMTYTVLVNISLSQLLVVRGDGSLPWGAGFDIVVAMPISWLPLAADYSRFARKTRSSFLGTWWGYFIMSSWMFLLGFFLSLVTGQSDPVPGMLAMGFGSIAFSVVLFSTFTTTFLDIYSTAVSFLNIIPRIQEKGAVLIFGSAGTILALFFSVEKYENFLYFIGSIFIPLFGVVLFDYFFYRRRIIDVPALLQRKDFDFVAMASWGLGFVCYELFLNYLPVVGASLPSLFTSGGCYLLFRRFGK